LEEVPIDQRDQTSMTMAIDSRLLPEAIAALRLTVIKCEDELRARIRNRLGGDLSGIPVISLIAYLAIESMDAP
jgi:hypothetical protein